MKDKKTLITIIVLLVITLPLGILGTIKKYSVPSNTIKDDNPNKEFVYNNKLYFYLDNKLLGTYECNNCSMAIYDVNDKEYHTNSLTNKDKEITGTISNYFGLFRQGENTVLYNLVSKKVIDEYKSIKDYRINSSNNFLITEKRTGFGITFLDLSHQTVPNDYDYIAVCSHLTDNVLDATNFIVKKDNIWALLNEDGTIIKEFNIELVDYSTNYYILYDGVYHIVDSDDKEYLENVEKSNVYGVDKYIMVLNSNGLFVYENLENLPITGKVLPSYNEISFNKTTTGIEIILDGNVYETLELS